MEFSFDFKMTEENKKVIENLLKQKGLKHYVLEAKDKEKLDLVEYKDYQELEEELDKYKSLYQNEKSHTDTLKRIIKKIEKYIEENNLFCYKYDEEELAEIITDEKAKKYLLDLLKEIK